MAGSCPIGLARAAGATVGWLAFALGIRRRVSVDNIVGTLGVTPRAAAGIARRSYQNLGRSVMEFAAFRRWSADDIRRLVGLEGVDHLVRVRAAGKGAVCVAGHFGSWELLPAVLVAHGFPTHGVIGRQTNERVDDVMNELRRAQGVTLIPRGTALKKVLLALRANEFVILLADQDARKGGVVVDFLGRPASTVRGPALFAVRSGCPLVTLSIHRDGGRHHAIAEPPIWPDRSLDEEAAVVDLTRRHAEALSRRIREHPDEYFWPHRRWKSTGF